MKRDSKYAGVSRTKYVGWSRAGQIAEVDDDGPTSAEIEAALADWAEIKAALASEQREPVTCEAREAAAATIDETVLGETAGLSPPLIVFPTKFSRGFDGSKLGGKGEMLGLREALEQHFQTDAHAVGYVIDGEKVQFRVNKPGLAKLRTDGVQVLMRVVMLDLDRRDKNTPRVNCEHQIADERELIDVAIANGLPRTSALYPTRGGWRLVYVLSEPVPVDEAEPHLRGLIRLARDAGLRDGALLHVDEACKSWNWSFRMPYVVRGGVPTWTEDYMRRGVEFPNSKPLDLRSITVEEEPQPPAGDRVALRPFDLDELEPDQREYLANYATKALKNAADRIIAAAQGKGHAALLREGNGIGNLIAAGVLDQDDAEEHLFSAVEERYRDRDRQEIPGARLTIRDGIRNGATEPTDVARLLERKRKQDDYSRSVADNLSGSRPVDDSAIEKCDGAEHPVRSGSLRSVGPWILEESDVPPVVEDLVYERELVMGYGAPGSGKTLVILDLALSLAYGLLRWAGYELPEGGRQVVYISAEGNRGIRKRIRAWAMKHGKGDVLEVLRRLDGRFYLFEKAVGLLSGAEWQSFRDELDAHEDLTPGLFVFDTLSRCIAGADENAAKEMTVAVERLGELARDTGAAVVVVHHSAKAGTAERGSSVWAGAVDVKFKVTQDAGKIVVEFDKMKDGELPTGGLAFRVEQVAIGKNAKGKSQTSAIARFEPRRVDGVSPSMLKMLRALKAFGGPGTAATEADWKKALGLAPKARGGRFGQDVKNMIERGILTEPESGAHGTLRYSIAAHGWRLLEEDQSA